MTLAKNSLIALMLVVTGSLFSQDITWMSWEEAVKANEQHPKKIFVDVYTDWCGWCKKMDAGTFKDPEIVKMMNESFYAIKLNAEQKDTISWNGMEFPWVEGGRRGYNLLALEILDKQMSFPSFVLLDSTFARIMISPGYKEPDALMKQLRFAKEEAYRDSTWEIYQSKS